MRDHWTSEDGLLAELQRKADPLGLSVQVVRYERPYYQVFLAGQLLLSCREDHAPHTIRLFFTMYEGHYAKSE